MDEPRLTTSSDYASLSVDGCSFYFGYEVTDPETDEWCFEAKFPGGKSVVYTATELRQISRTSQFECENNLLAGIAKLIAEGVLQWGTPL